jgi:hypothetical protein
VIPAGVLSFDGERWISARKSFLFPVKALSRVFRRKFIKRLKKAFRKNRLIFPGQLAYLEVRENFKRAIGRLWQKDWVVYSKAPFNGPQKVLDYLGRYTHRVAIANHRIVKVEDGLVTFQYRDRRDRDKSKLMTINAEAFIHRFLLHVIPDAYKRIRHFGFLANRCKKQQLRKCRELLGLCPEPPQIPEATVQEKMLRLTGVDITECPRCKQGHMKRVMELPILTLCTSMDRPMVPEAFDTS